MPTTGRFPGKNSGLRVSSSVPEGVKQLVQVAVLLPGDGPRAGRG